MNRMISIVVVDDQVMIRMAVKGILESAGDIQVIGEADRAAEAVAMVKHLKPAIVLMDLRMPGMDGVEAIRQIVADPSLAATRVLVLTTFEGDEDVVAALRAGAHGFLGKAAEPADLIKGVRDVAEGKALLSPSATQSVVNHIARRPEQAGAPSARLSSPQQVQSLTPREREIIRYVAEGLENETIATRLFISPHTVKTHINRTMQKLGVSGRAQLVRIAYEYDLINQTS
jgi:DNA-binding NarL/FixJ family response regulator